MQRNWRLEIVAKRKHKNFHHYFLIPIFLLFIVSCANQNPQIERVEVTRMIQLTAEPVVVTSVVTDVEIIEVTRVVKATNEPVTPEPNEVGGSSQPYLLILPPTLSRNVIMERGNLLVRQLKEMTEADFDLVISEDMMAAINIFCQEPDRAIALLPAFATLQAIKDCNAQPILAGVRSDVPYHAGMFVTLAGLGLDTDAGIDKLADLPDQRWGIADEMAVANTLAARKILVDAGITVSQEITYSSESNALLGLFAGEVDFVTMTFNPPLMPVGERWIYGETNSEVWRRLGVPPIRNPIGYVEVLGGTIEGSYRIRDGRAVIFDTQPTIFRDTRIIGLTPPIPNGSVVLGAEISLGFSNLIERELIEFAATDTCQQSICSPDFYNWSGLQRENIDAFIPLQNLNLDESDIASANAEF